MFLRFLFRVVVKKNIIALCVQINHLYHFEVYKFTFCAPRKLSNARQGRVNSPLEFGTVSLGLCFSVYLSLCLFVLLSFRVLSFGLWCAALSSVVQSGDPSGKILTSTQMCNIKANSHHNRNYHENLVPFANSSVFEHLENIFEMVFRRNLKKIFWAFA